MHFLFDNENIHQFIKINNLNTQLMILGVMWLVVVSQPEKLPAAWIIVLSSYMYASSPPDCNVNTSRVI